MRSPFVLLALALAAALWAIGFAGCAPLDDPARAEAALDEPYFRCRVQPVLGTSCAAFACHGAGERYFRLFARNRLRWGGDESTRNAALGGGERAANLEAARAMVDAQDPTQSLLLLKPLEQAAGGYYHRGATLYGAGNVFADRNDPDWKTIAAWVGGAKEDPSCIEPGSDQ